MPKVLIVDDEENVRYSFTSILTDEGYNVISAEHPIDALAIINANRFDVAVIDRILNSGNGMDIVKSLNKEQPLCTTILMSAYPNFNSASDGIKHNLFAYIQKPIKKSDLCSIVKRASENSMGKQIQKQNNSKLINLQRMSTFGLLAGGLIPDFNSIIMSFNEIAEQACSEFPPDNPISRQLKKLIVTSDNINNLSDTIFSYAQPFNNTFELTDIKSLIKRTLVLLRIILPKTIIVEETISNAGTKINVNSNQIIHALINLVINAVKTINNKKVKIEIITANVHSPFETQSNLEFVKISIVLNNCESDEKFFEKNYQPFFFNVVDSEDTDLSFNISYYIVKNHEGKIISKNKSGKNNRCEIYFPVTTIK